MRGAAIGPGPATALPGVELVHQRLNHLTYSLRRLTWREQARMAIAPGDDPRDAILALALHEVTGLDSRWRPGSPEDARAVILRIPRTLRWRLFIVYRGSLTEDRLFTGGELYRAPEYVTHAKRLLDEGDADENPEEHEIKARFGPEEAREARQLEATMAERALARRNG